MKRLTVLTPETAMGAYPRDAVGSPRKPGRRLSYRTPHLPVSMSTPAGPTMTV